MELVHNMPEQKDPSFPPSPAKPTVHKASASATHVGVAKKMCKNPNAPKRFKSSYICFQTMNRANIAKTLPPKSPVGQIAKRAAEIWRGMTPSEKKVWEDAAKADKERYFREKAAYDGPWHVGGDSGGSPGLPGGKGTRAKKDLGAPKRPMSAFLYFSQKYRPIIKEENPNLKNTEVSKKLGEMWRQAPEEERSMYVRREAQERAVFKVEMAKWRKEQVEMEKERERIAAEEGPLPADLNATVVPTAPEQQPKPKKAPRKKKPAAAPPPEAPPGPEGPEAERVQQEERKDFSAPPQASAADAYTQQQLPPKGGYEQVQYSELDKYGRSQGIQRGGPIGGPGEERTNYDQQAQGQVEYDRQTVPGAPLGGATEYSQQGQASGAAGLGASEYGRQGVGVEYGRQGGQGGGFGASEYSRQGGQGKGLEAEYGRQGGGGGLGAEYSRLAGSGGLGTEYGGRGQGSTGVGADYGYEGGGGYGGGPGFNDQFAGTGGGYGPMGGAGGYGGGMDSQGQSAGVALGGSMIGGMGGYSSGTPGGGMGGHGGSGSGPGGMEAVSYGGMGAGAGGSGQSYGSYGTPGTGGMGQAGAGLGGGGSGSSGYGTYGGYSSSAQQMMQGGMSGLGGVGPMNSMGGLGGGMGY